MQNSLWLIAKMHFDKDSAESHSVYAAEIKNILKNMKERKRESQIIFNYLVNKNHMTYPMIILIAKHWCLTYSLFRRYKTPLLSRCWGTTCCVRAITTFHHIRWKQRSIFQMNLKCHSSIKHKNMDAKKN